MRSTLALIVVTFLFGCAEVQQPMPSHFLGGDEFYQQMTYNPRYQVYEWFADPETAKRFESFYVEPVVVLMDKSDFEYGTDERDLEQLGDELRVRIIRELGPRHSMMNQPAKNKAILRIALTNVRRGHLLTTINPLTAPTSLGTGGATMETEVIDSVSGKRVAAVMDRSSGVGFEYFEGIKRWGNAERAFDKWAENLNRRLITARQQRSLS